MDEIQKTIESMILEIRGRQVMLDRDLARLYGVETKRLNEQVKRNLERFPDDFMFQLSTTEFDNWKSQFATSNYDGSIIMGARKLPYAFTSMRHVFARSADVFNRIEAVEHNQLALRVYVDKRFEDVFDKMEERSLLPKQGVFFDGQIFDAYAFVCGLVKSACKSIVLIDNYIDESVLMLLDKRAEGVYAVIYTKAIDRHLQFDIEKHNAQYPPIDVKAFQDSHDRFLIIDDTVYHIGASIKDMGKKWFAFSKMEIGGDELMKKICGLPCV